MSAQPKYVMQPDFDKALTAFSGYVDHTVNLTRGEIRREIIESEDRLRVEIQTQIQASEARLQAQIQASEERLQGQINDIKEQIGHVETVGKANHQMLQIMLDQFSKISSQLSKINQKLGID